MLEDATRYTSNNWIIHPLRPAVPGDKRTGKAPIENNWSMRLVPRSKEDLARFFGDGAGYNIGLLCGQVSNVTVIDVDDDLFIYDLLKGMDLSGFCMSKREGETHRGHLFFQYEPTLPSQKHHLIGLEVLSDGCNCVLPPSLHYSGTRYKWNPEGRQVEQLPKMPEKFRQRLMTLFKTYEKYKKLVAKIRPCFREFLKTPEKLHGGDGRLYMLALITEMAAAAKELEYGTQEANQVIHFAARLIYREDYDKARTTEELGRIDTTKTWRCATLQEMFYDRCNCSECKYHGEGKDHVPATQEDVKAALDRASQEFKDTLAMAEDMQKKVPIIYDETGTFWVWVTGQGYKAVDETDIAIALKDGQGLRSITNAKVKQGALEAIRMTGRERHRRTKPAKPTWVHFRNGIYDLATGEMFDATPDHFITTPIPHNLGTTPECPMIDNLLEQWIGPELKVQLYEILAYCLIDSYPIHRIFCLIGTGRNGKGQYMKLITRFVGKENVTSTEMERLVDSRFETAKLHTKKACFIAETNFSAISKTSRLKQLSGGDLVTGENKNKKPFDFVNTSKIIIATNSLPVTHDRTDGYYSRWMVIEFLNQFAEGKDLIDPIPESEFEGLARKCIDVLKELLQRGQFTLEGTIKDRERRYEEKSNPVAAFIKQKCLTGGDVWSPLGDLYDAYDVFQRENGYRVITNSQFSILLQELGFDKEKGRMEDYNGVYFWGLKLAHRGGPGIQQDLPGSNQGEQPDEHPTGQDTQAGHPVTTVTTVTDSRTINEIIETVRKFTKGSMFVKDVDALFQFYLDTHPYAKHNDQDLLATMIKLKKNGWHPPYEGTPDRRD